MELEVGLSGMRAFGSALERNTAREHTSTERYPPVFPPNIAGII